MMPPLAPRRKPFAAMISPLAARCMLLAVGVVAQLWLAHRYFGFLTGDDVEVLGEAFRRAVGLAYTPWDVRSLFVPDVVVAPIVWLATRLGVSDVRNVVVLAAIPFMLLTAVTTLLVRRLTLRWSGGDERAALLAMLFFALHWIPLGFGSTVYPRTLAMACIVAAALLVERLPFAAGLLVGVAFADRFSELVFLAPLAVACLGPRDDAVQGDRRPNNRPLAPLAKLLAGTALSIAITVGIYDWLTWGTPFSTALKFAHLTLVAPDFASRVKYQSPLWYVANILRWAAPTMLALLWPARRRVQWLYVVVPLVALSAVRHKELRYVQTMIPFLAVGAAIGASMLWERRRALAIALVAISMVWNLAGIRAFARKSQPAVLAARWLTAQPVHGVLVSQLWAYGGRLYFGNKIELVDDDTPPKRLHDLPSGVDAIALWETDLDDREILRDLAARGFHAVRTFRDGPARAVVVFRR